MPDNTTELLEKRGSPVRADGPRLVFASIVLVLLSYPSFAQTNLAGVWRPMPRNEDGSGMDGDYAGLPLSDAGRWRFRTR